MAARKNTRLDQSSRDKIQATQLVKRLQDYVNGKVYLDSAQVRAAEILLKKTLPDLQTVDINHGTQENDPIRELMTAVSGNILKPKG